LKKQRLITTALLLLFSTGFSVIQAQMITGVWKGKINKQKVEVKIIQNGDNLTGTAYYYESVNNYRRYSIKGYFDPNTNEAVWWDDQLLEEKTGRIVSPGKVPLLSRADFNCPGDGRMMLDGKASKVENENEKAGDVDLDKTSLQNFTDEWDFVIENYTVGANDPDIIDSIGLISAPSKSPPEGETWNNLTNEEKAIVADTPPVVSKPIEQPIQKTELPKEEPKAPSNPIAIGSLPVGETLKPLTIEEKFVTRKKVFNTEIPVSGDSIELRFYDNAQIDGDSISLFLNDKLIFEHIRLTEKAYTIKLPVTELNSTNELIMVAENLGSIPPNTSYMVALVGEKRYEARLESTEGSSALIRLIKQKMADER
jgi:hypothetical protein